jgi:hypothetical protein
VTARAAIAARDALVGATLLLVPITVGCSRTSDTTSNETIPVAREVDRWVQENIEKVLGLDAAIDRIIDAVESNDMRRFRDGPDQCASFAADLVLAAGGPLSDEQRTALADIADACAQIAGPARSFDSAAVMAGLEPLLVSLGPIESVLRAGRAAS